MQNNFLFLIFAILGLIQVVWLPGWLISYSLSQIKKNILLRIFVSFALSMIINSFIVFILTLSHIYTTGILLSIIFLEIIALVLTERRNIAFLFRQNISWAIDKMADSYKNILSHSNKWLEEEILSKPNKTFRIISLTLSLLTISYLIYLFFSNVGTLFNLSDAIFSWNRWAVQWSQNILPTDTWEYPQLLPTNWSIFYILLGQSGEFLAKIIMPLFSILLALSLFSFGIIKKKMSFILSVFTIFFLARIMNGYEILVTEGYADTAVSFFSLVPLIILYHLYSEKNLEIEKIKKYLYVGMIFVISALLTKQMGIYIAIIYLIAIIHLSFRATINAKQTTRIILIYLGLIFAFVLPYYIYREISINIGQDSSVIPTINTLIHGSNDSWLNILFNALVYIVRKSYLIIVIYFISAVYLLFKEKYASTLFALPAILLTIFWGLFLSYDSRNLTFAIFLLGICLALAIEHLVSNNKIRDFFIRIRIYVLFVFIVVLALISSPILTSKINRYYEREKRTIYNQELSVNISTYFASHNDNKKIYSNFALLHFLPNTKNRLLELNPEHFTNADNFAKYFETIGRSDIGYVLATNYSKKEIIADVKQKIKQGKFTEIFDIDGFILVKINENIK